MSAVKTKPFDPDGYRIGAPVTCILEDGKFWIGRVEAVHIARDPWSPTTVNVRGVGGNRTLRVDHVCPGHDLAAATAWKKQLEAAEDLFAPLKQALRETCGLSAKIEEAIDRLATTCMKRDVEKLAREIAEAVGATSIDEPVSREQLVGEEPKVDSEGATTSAILGRDTLKMFHDWLAAAGLILPNEQVRHLTLDIPLDDVVTVHVERMPRPENLTVKPPAVRVLRPVGSRAGLTGQPTEENATASSPTSEAADVVHLRNVCRRAADMLAGTNVDGVTASPTVWDAIFSAVRILRAE